MKNSKWIGIFIPVVVIIIAIWYFWGFTSDTFYYDKYVKVSGIDSFHLVKKGAFIKHTVSFDAPFYTMTKANNHTIIGDCVDLEGHYRFVATYDTITHKYKRITKIGGIELDQRISVNEDMSAFYCGERDRGIVRYDMKTGESSVLLKFGEKEKFYEPTVTRDEKQAYYLYKNALHVADLKTQTGTSLISGVSSYVLSHNEDFIIYSTGYTLYKYDIATGEHTELKDCNDRIYELSISGDDNKVGYVTYIGSIVPGLDNTIFHVYDLRTGATRNPYRSHYIESVNPIILW